MRSKIVVVSIGLFALMAGVAGATSAQNSIQPGKVFFGHVVSGVHPKRTVRLHNGTGRSQTISAITLAGSGGRKFTTVSPTTCTVGLQLNPGQVCLLTVRVKTTHAGWWRSVLRVPYASGWNNSAEVSAHVTG